MRSSRPGEQASFQAALASPEEFAPLTSPSRLLAGEIAETPGSVSRIAALAVLTAVLSTAWSQGLPQPNCWLPLSSSPNAGRSSLSPSNMEVAEVAFVLLSAADGSRASG